MSTHADKSNNNKNHENKNQSVPGEYVKQLHPAEASQQFIDARPETTAQRKLQALTNNSQGAMQLKSLQALANSGARAKQTAQLQSMSGHPAAQQLQPVQKKENKTGLPDDLKNGMENLSGMNLDGVKVHYNSPKPAGLQAHAYAQGSDIHVASGQEQHLPHELGHVVQQMQGRVQPTTSVGGMQVNDNEGLENEATAMGAGALQRVQLQKVKPADPSAYESIASYKLDKPLQLERIKMDVEEQAQKHHPKYKFKIGVGENMEEKDVDLDPWITRKGHGYDQKFVGRSEKKKLKNLIKSWDCKGSIVDSLKETLVGAEMEGGGVDFNKAANSFVGVDLATHLLALQENVARREGDIPVNCKDINLKKTPRVGEETTELKNVGWTTLLKESRAQLKNALLSGAKCPSAMGDVELVKVAAGSTSDPVISELIRLNVLDDEMKLNTATIRVGPVAYTGSNAGGGLFNFGYGHLRFILFLEWRICSELMLGQSVK